MQAQKQIKAPIFVKIVKSPKLKNKCRLLAGPSEDTLTQRHAKYVSGDFMFTETNVNQEMERALHYSNANEIRDVFIKL